MRISINWIKDFVDLSGIETDELIKRFNLATAEIEDVYKMGENTKEVVLARIEKIENHPMYSHRGNHTQYYSPFVSRIFLKAIPAFSISLSRAFSTSSRK